MFVFHSSRITIFIGRVRRGPGTMVSLREYILVILLLLAASTVKFLWYYFTMKLLGML